jgi:hypothetical protein
MPISSTNTAITFEAFYKTNGVRTTGLTVTVDILDPSNTVIINDAAATDAGQGIYAYTLAANYVTTAGLYKAIFTSAASTVDEREVIADCTVLGSNVQVITSSGNARAGMAYPISKTRALAHAGTADYDVAGRTYFTDDDIQAILDTHRTDFNRIPLTWQPVQVSGSAEYYDARFIPHNIERMPTGSGTTVAFRVENSLGSIIGTANYSVNYDARVITFTSDQRGTAYYLTGRTYNIYHAAAEIVRQKASLESASFDWSSDNHSVKAGKVYDNYMQQAERLQMMGGASVARAFRDDVRSY